MELQAYLKVIEDREGQKKLSDVKAEIIARLWREGAELPRGWVTSDELLALTGQKYFDRRIRELRDEAGCDIETGTMDGKHAYRLASFGLKAGNVRLYLTDAEKERLFGEHRWTCAVCRRVFAPGDAQLQADHKIPLVRGGPHGLSNWQPLCRECNIGKRSSCQGCGLDCQACSWAFPEAGLRLVVLLSRDNHALLMAEAAHANLPPDKVVAEALRAWLEQRRRPEE